MNWSVFDVWKQPGPDQPPGPPPWRGMDALVARARDVAHEQERSLSVLIQDWNLRLADLGGDPSRVSWASFRPLRLNREEAWSDWLAFLLESSTTRAFERQLLGDALVSNEPGPVVPVVVHRELATDGGEYRADLLLERGGRFAHIEVKVGDRHFEKTFPTAQKLRESRGRNAVRWTDAILLLDDDIEQWTAVVAQHAARTSAAAGVDLDDIRTITWRQVAIALRRSIRGTEEPLHWRVWAWTFSGAIEQRLLGHLTVDDAGNLRGGSGLVASLDKMARMQSFLRGVDET